MKRFTAPALAIAFALLYGARLRRSVLTWGASELEANSRQPGDELLERTDGVSTRAISIDAAAAAVWPWLAQLGPAPRGGAYTYDWIENLLGLNMHSVEHVLADFQDPQVGDTIGFGSNMMRLERVDPERVLAWRSHDRNWVWSFILDERGASTRLISRNRFRIPTALGRFAMLAMEPASLAMERKMLLGIKRRAERLACTASAPSEPCGGRGAGVSGRIAHNDNAQSISRPLASAQVETIQHPEWCI